MHFFKFNCVKVRFLNWFPIFLIFFNQLKVNYLLLSGISLCKYCKIDKSTLQKLHQPICGIFWKYMILNFQNKEGNSVFQRKTSHRLLYRNCTNNINMWLFLLKKRYNRKKLKKINLTKWDYWAKLHMQQKYQYINI